MNATTLKILACALMVVDHVGIIFYPDSLVLRGIGRLTFPVFAYLIVEGYRHTHDLTAYMGRLLVLGMASQLIYVYSFPPHLIPQFNVIFTLALGLYALYAYDKSGSLTPLLLCCLAMELGHGDYGFPAMLLMFVIHRYFDDLRGMFLAMIPIAVLMSVRKLCWDYFTMPGFEMQLSYIAEHSTSTLVQPLCVASVGLFALYNHKKGFNLKYAFYLFYPVHIGVLGLIKQYVK